jgi:hypothetical protein
MNFGDAIEFGRKRVRLALVFLACAILVQFVLEFLMPGLLNKHWEDKDGFFEFGCLVFVLTFTSISLAIWLWGVAFILLASWLLRSVFARKVNLQLWQVSTLLSLWPLPYASAAGAVVYIIYVRFHFGGWPDDVIFGTIGNILGAWCYLSVFLGWYQLTRGHRKS